MYPLCLAQCLEHSSCSRNALNDECWLDIIVMNIVKIVMKSYIVVGNVCDILWGERKQGTKFYIAFYISLLELCKKSEVKNCWFMNIFILIFQLISKTNYLIYFSTSAVYVPFLENLQKDLVISWFLTVF